MMPVALVSTPYSVRARCGPLGLNRFGTASQIDGNWRDRSDTRYWWRCNAIDLCLLRKLGNQMTVESIPEAFEEIVYYEGKCSGIGPVVKIMKASVFLAILIYLLGGQISQRMLDAMDVSKGTAWFYSFAAWVCGVAWIWWGWSSIRYKLTNRKITFEKGRFSKTIKSIDLWRVCDLIFKRKILESFFGFGTIVVVSKDATLPITTIGPICKAIYVYESLNTARELALRERGVMAVET